MLAIIIGCHFEQGTLVLRLLGRVALLPGTPAILARLNVNCYGWMHYSIFRLILFDKNYDIYN